MASASGRELDGGCNLPGSCGSFFYRAIAVDFDGTLTSDGRAPAPDVAGALAEARASGLRIILVTGRIIEELERAWPAVHQSVDCVVAENGAVLRTASWHRLLADPVDPRLDAALSSAGLPFRRGEVLIAAAAADEPSILGCIRGLHLGCETVANRSELMVLPAGVSKGTGLYHALGHFGLSFHNTIAIGDAENDLSLYERCELAVAVQDAVDPLKDHADLVLDEPDGMGIAAFLSGDVVRGRRTVHSSRWELHLGATAAGEKVSLPASQLNLLIAGDSGAGKSYLAGLLAEQLVEAGYSVLAVDPEGDHVGLDMMDGVLVVGGGERPPDPGAVLRLLHHRYTSVVVDLSSLGPEACWQYERRLLAEVEPHRRSTGLPHWVFIDEADQVADRVTAGLAVLEAGHEGYCLVTWRPQDLAAGAVGALDAVIAVGSPEPTPALVELAAAVAGIPRRAGARVLASQAGSAVLVRRDRPRRAQSFAVPGRMAPHLRHHHKYDRRPLGSERGFHFRRSAAERTGAVAHTLAELGDEVRSCDRWVLRHHCQGGDFSRWVAGVFRDPSLARRLELVEGACDEQSPDAVVEEARREILQVLHEKLAG